MSAPASAPRLTEQQARAVETRQVSVVLSSGAGCGKTHVLTERYLAHLRDGAAVGEIVAITFTDRAARQMRRRIRAAIDEHIRAATTDAEADAWVRHARDLEAAPISTIHAFCGTLLRQLAVEAGLDPQFEVLEEVLAGNLRTDAVAACLQRLLTAQTPVADDLRALVLLHGWRTVRSTVESLLHSHDAAAWSEWASRPAGEHARAWLQLAQTELLPLHLEHLLSTRPAIARTLDLLRRYPPLPGPMRDSTAILLTQTPRLAQATDLPAVIEQLREAAKVGRVGSKAWPDPAVYGQIKTAFEEFRKCLDGLNGEAFAADEEAVRAAVVYGQHYLRVADEAMRSYRERKRGHGIVDFQDLLIRARDLLRDRPAVRARLQERYRHLLIDELQDTDPVQMELVELLAGGGLTTGRLFAVGDHKQSIYRFRGADVSLFRRLRDRVPHQGRQTLSVNFRSQPAILDFANALMAHALPDYEPLTTPNPQSNPGPCVEFLWSPRPDRASVTQARSIEAEWIARRIAGLIGQPLATDETTHALRPVRPGDVVVLFRAMSNVHLYEAALRQVGLNYYLVGGRAFFAQQEIYDLVNLLRALENPLDALSLAGTLRSPFCCLSDETLFVLGQCRAGLWSALSDRALLGSLPHGQREAARRAGENLHHWRSLKDRLPIARLIAAVLAESGYDAAVRMEYLGDRKLANLWKLIELGRMFDRSGLFGLAEFIGWLGDLVTSQPREEQAATQPENADVIRLMTIHQAKGLEFPVVVVPDLAADRGGPHAPAARWSPTLGCVVRPPSDEDPPPIPEFGWRLLGTIDEREEWQEDLRTLYVACTRPRDYLILSAALPADCIPAGPWMLTLAQQFDLHSGACLDPTIAAGRRPLVRVIADSASLPPLPAVPETAPAPVGAPPAVPPLVARRGTHLVDIDDLESRLDGGESLFAHLPAPPPTSLEVVLRGVVERWDFRDADGWRPLLDRLSGRYSLHADERAVLDRLLGAFAASALRGRLARARSLRRAVDYLLRLSEDEPGVSGRIDLLFQDDKGSWCLLEWVTELVAAPSREACWSERQTRLTLAAEAIRRHHGEPPRTVLLALLREGEVLERPAARLLQPARLDRVRSELCHIRDGSVPIAAE